MVQISTGFILKIIKELDCNRALCEYEENCLYPKGRKAIFYKCDLRPLNIFDFIGSDKE